MRQQKFFLLTLFICILLQLGTDAWSKPEIALTVSLSPTGSFTARTARIHGAVLRQGKDGFVARQIRVDASSFETGVSLRDQHMRDTYFEVGKGPAYKIATLESAQGAEGKFQGQLRVHNVLKRIEGTYAWSDSELEAQFSVSYRDFGIAQAKYLGVGVEDQIVVKATVPIGTAKQPRPRKAKARR